MSHFHKFGIVVLALCLCQGISAGSFAAQRGEGGVVSITTNKGKTIQLYKASYALVVGVGKYTNGYPVLDSVSDEVKTVVAALREQGFEVRVVMNPDSKELKEAFRTFINDHGYDPETRLLFFFAGHGASRKDGKVNMGYLVPTDAPLLWKDSAGFYRKALSMSQVLTWCREMLAKHALFVFDSCFSGAIFENRNSEAPPPYISDYTAKPVRYFITAGGANETVPAQSVFTPSFVRGLRGEADLNRDSYITGTELGIYLHDKVFSYKKGQTPQHGKILDPALDEGDFVFQLKKEESPLPGGFEFVQISPGKYMAGSPEGEFGRDMDEVQHTVAITKSFQIQTKEVTRKQWCKVMGLKPPSADGCGENCPVTDVSWNEVQEFIHKLNKLAGKNQFRLPTEAEWEYACRAGSPKAFSFGECLSSDQANHDGEYPLENCSPGKYRNRMLPVGSLRANAWGIYDMHGNVSEWCQDWMGEYATKTVTNPKGPYSGTGKVFRGGSWKSPAVMCRSANRMKGSIYFKSKDIGFRLVKDVK